MKPRDPNAADTSKVNADLFCKSAGYPGAKESDYAMDKNIPRQVFGGLKDKVVLVKSFQYDEETKKMKTPKPEDIVPGCKMSEIMCDGVKASPVSGTSEQKDIKRAKFPPVMEIGCDAKMTSSDVMEYTKGDPGSIFTFKCAAGCKSEGTLIGAGLYHVNSSICKAGIQQSMYDDSQVGFVSVVIGYPTY